MKIVRKSEKMIILAHLLILCFIYFLFPKGKSGVNSTEEAF